MGHKSLFPLTLFSRIYWLLIQFNCTFFSETVINILKKETSLYFFYSLQFLFHILPNCYVYFTSLYFLFNLESLFPFLSLRQYNNIIRIIFVFLPFLCWSLIALFSLHALYILSHCYVLSSLCFPTSSVSLFFTFSLFSLSFFSSSQV